MGSPVNGLEFDPSEEQGGGEEAGAEGAEAQGRAGRRAVKKTPGVKATKLPACSLPSNMTPTFYVGGGNGTALVEGPLLAMGWKKITDKYDDRYRLKWVECKSKINYNSFKEGDQIVNHIPNCKLLTNKMGLLCSLQEYERVTLNTKGRLPKLKMSEFIPETYKLDEKTDRTNFLSVFKEGEVWICKPVGMNQGKGIFLLRSREEIDNLLSERDARKDNPKYSSRPAMVRIVQRYIPNPLLLDGRKFDIRAYMLIASTVPYLVLFHHGYIRLSCLKYHYNDTNLTTHLTNQFVQKKDPSYKDVKEDTAWSMQKFNDYINKHYAEEKGLEQDWTFNTLTKQMHRIVLHCFNSVKHKLQCKIGYFDLYGMDFMIDADMKVWLIEINVNPALHVNCEALKEVIPHVVEESLHVSIEAFDKARRNQPLVPLQTIKTFQVLHVGSAPFNTATRQTRSVSPSKGENPDQYRARQAQTAHTQNRHISPPRSLARVSLSTTQVSPYTSSSVGGVRTLHQKTLPNITPGSGLNQPPAAQSTIKFSGTTNNSATTPSSTDQEGGSSHGYSEPAAVTNSPGNPSSNKTNPSHQQLLATSVITLMPANKSVLLTSRQAIPASDYKMTDEYRLKMTRTGSARKSRDKSDRGN